MSGNFIVYLIGYIVAIIGVAYGLSAAGLGQEWIIAVVLILAGLGIVYALSHSQRDEQTKQQAAHSRSTSSPSTSAEQSESSRQRSEHGSA